MRERVLEGWISVTCSGLTCEGCGGSSRERAKHPRQWGAHSVEKQAPREPYSQR